MRDKPTVELIEHDEGYHEIVFHDNHRMVVDQYIEIVETLLLQHVKANDVARMLINLSEGKMPPLASLSQQMRTILHEHRDERERLHLRGAFLASSSDAIILSLMESFIRLMPIDAKIHTFTTEHRVEAVEWLLGDKDG